MRFGIVFLCSNNRWSYTDFLRNEAKMTPKIAPPISPPRNELTSKRLNSG